jgi:hypothetical protein
VKLLWCCLVFVEFPGVLVLLIEIGVSSFFGWLL